MKFRKTLALLLAALCFSAAAVPADAAIISSRTQTIAPKNTQSQTAKTPTQSNTTTESRESTTITPDKEWYDGKHPYPALLDFTDLDYSFNTRAGIRILEKNRGYVLNALKYHIASATDDYRAARTLAAGENLMFFFEGCSVNLEGATITTSGFLMKGRRYNTSAVFLLVQKNSKGRAEITFVSGDASTMPDNVRDTSMNGDFPVPTVKDGIYKITAVNHHDEYAAFHLDNPAVVRCSKDGSTENLSFRFPRCDEINIHIRAVGGITTETAQSVGCLAMENSYNSNYFRFVETAAKTTLPSSLKFIKTTEGRSEGLVIIDRSLYKSQLAKIYGNDSAADGLTGAQIAAKITEGSNTWSGSISPYSAAVNVQPVSQVPTGNSSRATTPTTGGNGSSSNSTTKKSGGIASRRR